jgi:hypothetical protein
MVGMPVLSREIIACALRRAPIKMGSGVVSWGLAIPGLMIDEAADNQMRQQGAARHDLGQREIDGRGLADLLACPAGVLSD